MNDPRIAPNCCQRQARRSRPPAVVPIPTQVAPMKPTPGPAPAARRSAPLALETLEARNLFSAGGLASLANLTVNPTSYNSHDILVAFQGSVDLSALSPAVVLRNSAL